MTPRITRLLPSWQSVPLRLIMWVDRSHRDHALSLLHRPVRYQWILVPWVVLPEDATIGVEDVEDAVDVDVDVEDMVDTVDEDEEIVDATSAASMDTSRKIVPTERSLGTRKVRRFHLHRIWYRQDSQ